MRHALVCALFLCASAFGADLHQFTDGQPVTLVFEFEGEHSQASIDSMKREFQSIMEHAKLSFDYRLRSEFAAGGPVAQLILIRFKGHCRMDRGRPASTVSGPYALTHTVDGHVLPFMEVRCDRIQRAVRETMRWDHRQRSDFYFGRALARVLAHEIYHILGKTSGHGSKGIAKPAFSGEELLGERLALESEDVIKIREAGM